MNKILIGIIVLGSLAATSNQVLGSTGHSSGHNHNTTFNQTSLTIEFQKPLLIPPLLKGEVKDGVRNFDLNVTKGKWEFIDGKFTETYGYNGPILGPVLSLKKGEKTKVNIKNKK